MSGLTPRERELVALAAALGSNCAPCVDFHVPEARKAGLDDAEIREALDLADRTRQVPARKALDAGLAALGKPGDAASASANTAGACADIMRGAAKCGC